MTELSSEKLRFLGSILDTISKYSSVLSILTGVVASRGCWEIFFHVIPSLFWADHKIADSLGHSSRSQTPCKTICSLTSRANTLCLRNLNQYLYILQNIIRDLWRCTSTSPFWLNCSFVQKRSIIQREWFWGLEQFLLDRNRYCIRGVCVHWVLAIVAFPWCMVFLGCSPTTFRSLFRQNSKFWRYFQNPSRFSSKQLSIIVWITSASLRELRWRVSSYCKRHFRWL